MRQHPRPFLLDKVKWSQFFVSSSMDRKKRIKREERVKESTLLFPTNPGKKPHNPGNKLVIPKKTRHTFVKKGL